MQHVEWCQTRVSYGSSWHQQYMHRILLKLGQNPSRSNAVYLLPHANKGS